MNLAVADLKRSIGFFSHLGFDFDPQFTDNDAACMVVNNDAFIMLLTESYFRGFSKKQRCNTASHSEGILAVSCQSRGEVDELAQKALAQGGAPAMEPVDNGFMYGRSFYDPDGHHWEVMWMDPKAAEKPSLTN